MNEFYLKEKIKYGLYIDIQYYRYELKMGTVAYGISKTLTQIEY